MKPVLTSGNGCTCDYCAPTPEAKAEASAIGAAISERNALFDAWLKIAPDERPPFHQWADAERSRRRAHGLIEAERRKP